MAAADRDRVAFLEAATWSDEIKNDSRYQRDSYTPTDPAAADITGYADLQMHRGWHFKDIAFSPDQTPLEDAFAPKPVITCSHR